MLKSKAFVLFLLFFAIAQGATAEQTCHVLFTKSITRAQELPFRKFKPELSGAPYVTLSRFAGFNSFHEVQTSQFALNDDVFSITEHGIHSRQVGFGETESFVHRLQDFPLAKMVETGYLQEQEAQMFKNLGASLAPGQVNFFEVTRFATAEELKKYSPEMLKSRVAKSWRQSSQTSVRTATLWSVAGQITDFGKSESHAVQLPWEKEEARKGQELDRTKYKFVWEWGRAAQDMAEEIAPIYAANAALNYMDLIANGGRLEDAYVMFHSFDKVNTRLYLSEHPGSTYPPDWKDKSDMLFLVPLGEMLKKYPPSRFSEKAAKIIAASDGKIGELQALEVLLHLRLLGWEELNLQGKIQQNGPVIINDPADGRLLGLHILLNQYGLTREQFENIMDYIVPLRPTLYTNNAHQKYKNATDSIATTHDYHENNAVEISNLDPELAKKDPNYVMAMTFEAYIYYLNRMSRLIQQTYKIPKSQAHQEALKIMLKHDIKFGVTTAAPEILEQCEKLHPVVTAFVSAVSQEIDRDTLTTNPYFYKSGNISIFSMQQILNWATQYSQFFANTHYPLGPGYWWSQYLFSQVDLL